jgi:hypothetical protein
VKGGGGGGGRGRRPLGKKEEIKQGNRSSFDRKSAHEDDEEKEKEEEKKDDDEDDKEKDDSGDDDDDKEGDDDDTEEEEEEEEENRGGSSRRCALDLEDECRGTGRNGVATCRGYGGDKDRECDRYICADCAQLGYCSRCLASARRLLRCDKEDRDRESKSASGTYVVSYQVPDDVDEEATTPAKTSTAILFHRTATEARRIVERAVWKASGSSKTFVVWRRLMFSEEMPQGDRWCEVYESIMVKAVAQYVDGEWHTRVYSEKKE